MYIVYYLMIFLVYIYLWIIMLGIKDGCGYKLRGNFKSIEFLLFNI